MTHRFLAALHRQPVDRTPVWLMRQAGRYLPEYRQIRAQIKDFMSLCKNPELACEVTMQPTRRFALDAAIVFSDILTIPDAMGLGLRFVENEGPCFDRPVQTREAIVALPQVDVDNQLHYVMDTIARCKTALAGKLPLIGFSGSPWTLACYMVQGGSSKDFARIKQWLYQDPQALHLLLQKLASTVSDYLLAQIKAGADAVMLFDTWGGILTPIAYQQFSLHYMRQIIENIRKVYVTPIIMFTKNAGQWLEVMADSGCDAIGVDWTTDIGVARQRVGSKVALQGNMDPTVLLSTPQRVQEEVKSILQQYGSGPGHIFNLGHGILQQTPPENVAAMIEAVQAYGLLEAQGA